MDDSTSSTQTKLDEITIFNQLNIREYIGTNISAEDGNNSIYICGKIFSHLISAKYSFKACEFLIYTPFNNKLFYSTMNSDECFTSTLKWNHNFFKKVRLCLESSEKINNTYFSINYENKIDIKINNTNRNLMSNNIATNFEIEECEYNEEFTDKKLYFELHFVVDGQDIIAFRMHLNHIIDDKPNNTLLNKLLEYDKQETEIIADRQIKLHDKQREIDKMEKEIKKTEDDFSQFKKQSLYKLYYLNKEKNKKITELNNQLKKEKKIAHKFM